MFNENLKYEIYFIGYHLQAVLDPYNLIADKKRIFFFITRLLYPK